MKPIELTPNMQVQTLGQTLVKANREALRVIKGGKRDPLPAPSHEVAQALLDKLGRDDR